VKRLINGNFSSIPDAELITKISADIESDITNDITDKTKEQRPSDGGDDTGLPS